MRILNTPNSSFYQLRIAIVTVAANDLLHLILASIDVFSPGMIEAAIKDQFVQETAMGIGDILNAAAARSNGTFVPRIDRPDLLVIDPSVEPLFRLASLLTTGLGITLPRVMVMPSAGLLEN